MNKTLTNSTAIMRRIRAEKGFRGQLIYFLDKKSFFSHEIFLKAAKVQGFHRALYNYIELARKTNQSILKEIHPEYSLEGLVLKLKLQHFGHLIGRGDSLEKTLRLGKNEGRRRGAPEDERVGWQHRLKGHEFEQTLKDGEGQGSQACCSPWGRRVRLGD